MFEGALRQSEAPSRRLPPSEAWRSPDKWIDTKTGLVRPDASTLILPTDDRGFLRPDQVVGIVNEVFFWDDYDWPFTPGDKETEPDDHHFYYDAQEYEPKNNEGSITARLFRNLPPVIGRMPRQFHNTIHDLTTKPEIPDREDMEAYYQSYRLAERAFKRLFLSATKTSIAARQFSQRRSSIASGLIQTNDDEIGEAILRSFFDKHFVSYSEAIQTFRTVPDKHIIDPNFHLIERSNRQVQVKILGKVVSRKHINFISTLRTT
jgi:hypothetical protein